MLVTCSDASMSGASVATSAGLTVQAATDLPPELPVALESGVALASMSGGIEAGGRAFDLIGIRPNWHISIENHRAAVRAVGEVFPDIQHFREIRQFARDAPHIALAGVRIIAVIVLAGFPYLGLSGANA